jgi:hypothetical protein
MVLRGDVESGDEERQWREQLLRRREHLLRLLEAHSRNLTILEREQAKYGVETSLRLLNQIEAERLEIVKLQKELKELDTYARKAYRSQEDDISRLPKSARVLYEEFQLRRKRLESLELRAARYGSDTPVSIQLELEEERKRVASIVRELQRMQRLQRAPSRHIKTDDSTEITVGCVVTTILVIGLLIAAYNWRIQLVSLFKSAWQSAPQCALGILIVIFAVWFGPRLWRLIRRFVHWLHSSFSGIQAGFKERAALKKKRQWQCWVNEIESHLERKGKVSIADRLKIPKRKRLESFARYIREHAAEDLVYDDESKALMRRYSPIVMKLRQIWSGLESSLNRPVADFILQVQNLTQVICSILGIIPPQSAAPVEIGRIAICEFELGPVFEGIKLSMHIPVVCIQRRAPTSTDLDQIRHYLSENPKQDHQVVLYVHLGSDQAYESVCRRLRSNLREIHAHDVIPLSRDDLQAIAESAEPQLAFRRIVLQYVDLASVAPFVITGPTPDRMFFGREHELIELAEGTVAASYAIIGGRRVGKTSILGRLHRLRLPAAGFRTLYHDCSTTPTYDAFIAAAIRDWRPESPPDIPTTFNDLLQSSLTDRPLVLLLDEADKLVPADRANNWELFKALRALVNSGRAQVVLSGERALRDAMRDPESPLFNFANEMLLGPLEFRAVEELVTRPMKQLEIELVEEKVIVDRIWAFTSGHPNIVQRLCRRLIERLNERIPRCITLDDVNAVINDPRFQEEDFLNNLTACKLCCTCLLRKILSPNRKSSRPLSTG